MESEQIRYSVQVGAFRTKEAAERYAKPLIAIGYPVNIVSRGPLYVILIGNYSLLEEATEAEGDLRALGFQTIVKEFDEKELNY